MLQKCFASQEDFILIYAKKGKVILINRSKVGTAGIFLVIFEFYTHPWYKF